MFDTFKIRSQKLGINIKINVFLPKTYEDQAENFKSITIVSKSDPFTNDLQELFEKNNLVVAAIYPEQDIDKNQLLFNEFKDKYGFAHLYNEEIAHTIIPVLKQRFRINKDEFGNYIYGFDDTAILAYTVCMHYPTNFEQLILKNLDVNGFYKEFLTDMKSVFNPSTKFIYQSNNRTLDADMHEILCTFGAIKNINPLNKGFIYLLENI